MSVYAGQRIRALDFAGYANIASLSNFVDLQPPASETFFDVNPVLGVAFTAPTSGCVKIQAGGRLRMNQESVRVGCAAQVRTGDVIGSGVVHTEPSGDYSYEVGVSAGGVVQGTGSAWRIIPGLEPGALYHLVWMCFAGDGAAAASVNVYARWLSSEPWHNQQ